MSFLREKGTLRHGRTDEVIEAALAGVTLEQLRAAWELVDADVLFASGQDAMPTLLCNDVFVPAADCEGVTWAELPALRDLYRAEGDDGLLRWIAARRGIPAKDWHGRRI